MKSIRADCGIHDNLAAIRTRLCDSRSLCRKTMNIRNGQIGQISAHERQRSKPRANRLNAKITQNMNTRFSTKRTPRPSGAFRYTLPYTNELGTASKMTGPRRGGQVFPHDPHPHTHLRHCQNKLAWCSVLLSLTGATRVLQNVWCVTGGPNHGAQMVVGRI